MAHLERADLFETHREGANLQRAEGVTQDQIEQAFGDARTLLPAGLSRPARWTASNAAEAGAAPAA